MTTTDYKSSMTVQASPEAIFSALTTGIAAWWSEDYSGAAAKVNDEFTVKFQGKNLINMRVTELVPNKKVTWTCLNFFIDVDAPIDDRSEWIGTKVFWEISPSKLDMLHEGLTQEFECYSFCSAGWVQFLGSLKDLLNGGAGSPYKA
jgi:uncharacterized protein YndB with AHSA1/START domain